MARRDCLFRYALFLDTTARDVKSAEPVYLRAIEAAPTDADSLRNFAVFLSEKLKDFARADDYFARAVQVCGFSLCNLQRPRFYVNSLCRLDLTTTKSHGSTGGFCAKS
jgi:Tfp pilus assembly protein PilF